MKKNIIIDIPTSNTGSILNVVSKLGFEIAVSRNLNEISNASKIILPGHGTFLEAKKFLVRNNLFDFFCNIKKKNIFYLGICVGMQMLARYSYENEKISGFGILDANVEKIKVQDGEKTPHIGWNQLNITNRPKYDLFKNINNKQDIDVYFSHSYAIYKNENSEIVGTTPYANNFVSAVNSDKIFGVQFHPEKSSLIGVEVLKNFLNFD